MTIHNMAFPCPPVIQMTVNPETSQLMVSAIMKRKVRTHPTFAVKKKKKTENYSFKETLKVILINGKTQQHKQ